MGKGSKQKSKGGGGNEDVKREHPLQAVVFADSFTNTFRPVTLEKPKVLLPLVNTPMLDYTIEFLASSGVEEIIVFCISHAEEIEAYLTKKWRQKMSIECVTSNNCLTAGDAIRELDQKSLIKSDPFIMLRGDVISNMNLSHAISEHKQRKKQDSSSIMTMIFKKAQSSHPNRSLVDDLVVAIDQQTNQVVMYEDSSDKIVALPTLLFKEDHSEIQFRYDLLDCHIDICSPDVLVQFSDNFDYQDTRKHFVHNEVQNFELGHKIHAKIIEGEYAACIHDPRTYAAVSEDIINRWTYPMVPDNNWSEDSTYTYVRGGICKEENVTLARSCSVKGGTIIGSETVIGASSSISSSVIGRNCVIGNNVNIEGSYIWGNVAVGDGASICNAIICDKVIIGDNADIQRGCIVSFGVTICDNTVLKEFSKVTVLDKLIEENEFGSDSENELNLHKSVADNTGTIGVGRRWSISEDIQALDLDASDSDDDEVSLCAGKSLENTIQKYLIGCTEMELVRDTKWKGKWDNISEGEDDDLMGDFDEDIDPKQRFIYLVKEMIVTATVGSNLDDIFLEIKSLKFAQDRSFCDCIEAIVSCLLSSSKVVHGLDSKSDMNILQDIQSEFNKWNSVLKRCIISEVEQSYVIEALELGCSDANTTSRYSSLFGFLLQIAYDLEWVTEDILLKWAAGCKANPDSSKFFEQSKVQEFIEWLEDDDESDGESEEESD